MDLDFVTHAQHLTYESFAAQVGVIAVQQVRASVTQGFIGIAEADGMVVWECICIGESDSTSHVIGSDAIPAVLLDIVVLDDNAPVAGAVLVHETVYLLRAVVKAAVFTNKHIRDGYLNVLPETLGNIVRCAVGAQACTIVQNLNMLMSFDSIHFQSSK